VSNLRIIDVSPESTRLDVLRGYAILDTNPEKPFNEIVRLASVACELPAAALTFVDAKRCWFKARIGVDDTETPRSVSFCGHAFKSSGTFIVPDALADERFSQLPLVTEKGVRFYAGIPLITPDGHSLGTLCVLDQKPRELSTLQLTSLRALASHAMMLLDRRHPGKSTPPGTSTPSRGIGSVLIVDDDPDVLAFSKIAVQRIGFEVLTATNGKEALEVTTRHAGKIDVVLTDVNMPVMDGLELVRALKRLPMTTGIVVMSGRFEGYMRAAFHAEEVTKLLGKPFSVDELELTLLQARASVR